MDTTTALPTKEQVTAAYEELETAIADLPLKKQALIDAQKGVDAATKRLDTAKTSWKSLTSQVGK